MGLDTTETDPAVSSTNAEPTIPTPAARVETPAAAPRKVRTELNLEKWPQIFAPSHAKVRGPRTYSRSVTRENGMQQTVSVTVQHMTGKGTLTHEDFKTYAGLLHLWENAGRPLGKPVSFSRRKLAQALKKEPDAKTLRALKASLLRLRLIPLSWVDSFFDKEKGKWLTIEDPMNIITNITIVERHDDSGGVQLTLELGSFKFDDRILANILNNYSKPLQFDTVADIRGEIALVLYRHLDNVLADKTHYERRLVELFQDLDLTGTYKYPSKRAEKITPAIRELYGKPISTGTLSSLTLEKTNDGKDFKLVANKAPNSAAKPRPAPQPRQREFFSLTDPQVESALMEAFDATGDRDQAHRPIFNVCAKLYGPDVLLRAASELRAELQQRKHNNELPAIRNAGAYYVAICQRIARGE